jgi:predicted short-subunit dehydrogenase-like oxidoreductase (DUF2520 family)
MPSVTIIGAGRLGRHLVRALYDSGTEIHQVYNRTFIKAQQLADLVHGEPIDDISNINQSSDIYLLTLSDDAIQEIAQQLSQIIPSDKIVAHTSGATPGIVLASYFEQYGVFYPLQSFSEESQPDFQKIPFCIHSPVAHVQEALHTLAKQLSTHIYVIDDEQRSILHLSAVMVNNFTNYLFTVAYDITKSKNIPFELLLPLIKETVDKLSLQKPELMQTGPARRGDQSTITRHLAQLDEWPPYKEIYHLLSKQLLDRYKR